MGSLFQFLLQPCAKGYLYVINKLKVTIQNTKIRRVFTNAAASLICAWRSPSNSTAFLRALASSMGDRSSMAFPLCIQSANARLLLAGSNHTRCSWNWWVLLRVINLVYSLCVLCLRLEGRQRSVSRAAPLRRRGALGRLCLAFAHPYRGRQRRELWDQMRVGQDCMAHRNPECWKSL